MLESSPMVQFEQTDLRRETLAMVEHTIKRIDLHAMQQTDEGEQYVQFISGRTW